MKKINKFKNFGMLYLVLAMVFILPLQFGNVYGVDGDNIITGTHSKAQAKSLCGNNAGTNVKGSLILSIVTLCLPGILEKVWQWNQIKCQEVQCHYNAVLNNLDPTFCSKSEAYQVCTLIIGEMFSIPPLAILEYYRKAMSQILANPVGTAFSIAVTASRKYMYSSCGEGESALCTAPVMIWPVILVTAIDIAALAQRIMDMFENGFFPPGAGSQKNYCDGISDIVKEMQLIVDKSSK